ncbi:hypothetical protein BCR33DRAFT_215874 [Rhizoclosmatium globosum]|uniref:Uncharacterized protein n=1 Tax=Rhizoclosmatium globosum TaxID=329046 RepID=A0A1Y2AER5_9FUNG|nr:hypothetical protein BCR33DRAFT_215874 [Rhizoclosmatium globosum]|eukprot:ORY21083.1 hypothetical protein BCR33DRAFT_215874 [Rhizoclosmatium globosum]
MVFYNESLLSGVILRQMLTDRGRIDAIIERVQYPSKQTVFEFANYAVLTVFDVGSKAQFGYGIRVFEFTVEHLTKQIEQKLDVSSHGYKLSAALSVSGNRIPLTMTVFEIFVYLDTNCILSVFPVSS